ncbi:MAG: hypothetical protein V3V32_05420 [Dehalococcoidia bacterium]
MDQVEHCCQLAEIGGFDRYEEDAYNIAEDNWYQKNRDADKDMPDVKITPAMLAEAIDNDLDNGISHFATTAAHQELAEKALRKLGFRNIASFPGTGARDLKLWLRPRKPPIRRKATDGRSLRERAKRQGTSKRA